MKYLTTHNIAAARLTAIGLGVDKPIADNSTEEGREQNRRVEFAILEMDGSENNKGTK
jgi:outer membrane protein OmpA-like peptidoglycan-associated protein